MNGTLRHLAVRLWATVFCGGLSGMVVLPFWQSILKVQWAFIPAGAMLIICFFILGWVMNRLGMAKIQRLSHEAGVWERAGDFDTAEEVFERAKTVFDSFWLSPTGRRQAEELITARLARFYQSQPSPAIGGRDLIKRYLMRHPQDAALARSWLEQLPGNPEADHQADILAAHIGEALPDDPDIQLLLMQYYLSAQRCDYDAIQTYRRVRHLRPDLPDADLQALARVLLKNNQLNDWALQIYLKGYDSGEPYCLEGIAAAARLLRPHPGNQRALAQARRISETLDPRWREKAAQQLKDSPSQATGNLPGKDFGLFLNRSHSPQQAAGNALAVPFKPIEFSPRAAEPARPKPNTTSTPIGLRRRSGPTIRMVIGAAVSMLNAVRRSARTVIRQVGRVRHLLPQSILRPRTALIVTGFSLAAVIMLMAGFRVSQLPDPLVHDNHTVIEQPLPPVEQPFTIQVAAYLKPEDAQRYVTQLQKKGLEAFSTQAVSSQRKWYQVKVSRFETRLQARNYGEKLKSSGLIDDFYVANYLQQR